MYHFNRFMLSLILFIYVYLSLCLMYSVYAMKVED